MFQILAPIGLLLMFASLPLYALAWVFSIKGEMHSLERLAFRGTERCSQYRWKRFAVCGRRVPLDRVRSSQRNPEDWRVVFMPCQMEDVMKNLQRIA